MSGKERGDCFKNDGGKTVEERLAEAALREELRERGRPCGASVRGNIYQRILFGKNSRIRSS
jgi:hypothetical protein